MTTKKGHPFIIPRLTFPPVVPFTPVSTELCGSRREKFGFESLSWWPDDVVNLCMQFLVSSLSLITIWIPLESPSKFAFLWTEWQLTSPPEKSDVRQRSLWNTAGCLAHSRWIPSVSKFAPAISRCALSWTPQHISSVDIGYRIYVRIVNDVALCWKSETSLSKLSSFTLARWLYVSSSLSGSVTIQWDFLLVGVSPLSR